MRGRLILPSALLVPALLAACGSGTTGDRSAQAARSSGQPAGSAEQESRTGTGSPVATTGLVCAAQAKGHAATVPAGFPADFPLPPGMIVTTAEDRGSAGIVLTGVTDQPFAATLDALHTQLPKHGYTAEEGESEPHDAESDWTSARYEGRWAIREASGCADDTAIQVVARPK